MQKSPAIGHGCSCLGQAAVAATKSEKKRYSSTLECEIRANIAKLSVKPFLFLSHRYIYLSLSFSLSLFRSIFHTSFEIHVYARTCNLARINRPALLKRRERKKMIFAFGDSGSRDRVHFHFNRPARGSVFGVQMRRVARRRKAEDGENRWIYEQERPSRHFSTAPFSNTNRRTTKRRGG